MVNPSQAPSCRVDLFDALTSNEELDTALSEFSAVVCERTHALLLEHFFERPLVVEIILTGLNGYGIPLKQWILDSYPVQLDGFTSSFTWKLLSRLANFFRFESIPLPDVDSGLVSQYDDMINAVPYILDVLSSMSFGSDNDHASNHHSPSTPKAKKNWKKVQPLTKPCSNKKVDSRRLEAFSISVPGNNEDKERAITDVLRAAKAILMFYLDHLCLPTVSAGIRTSFLNQARPVSGSVAPRRDRTESDVSPSQEVPSAYPIVQPLKAARHFNSAEGFGEWRILISTRADKDLREASRKDPKSFKIIVKKIKELSNGHFSKDNHKRLSGPNIDVPIFEAKMASDSRLVYQIDSMSDYDSEGERQVIRIFGIYTHAQMDGRLWDSVGHQLCKKGKEYKRRCTVRRQATSGDNNFLPASFPALEEDPSQPIKLPDLPPDDLEQIHSLLVLEKYLTFSRELLNSILANLDVAFPFQVSSQERDIIQYPHSCFVLGRSGTGKTTTMLFKMLWIERAYQLNSDCRATKPRQIFVTKSRVLAGKVEEYFSKLLDSLKMSSKSIQELKKIVARNGTEPEEDNLIDFDEDEHWRADLPSKYSGLEDSNFPLFITFDRLCDLIEADFETSERASYLRNSDNPRVHISYSIFQEEYWPHFPRPLTKSLDPASVFSEVLGVIMGSEEAASMPDGYLDRETYQDLSVRRHPTFASKRSTIYSIFEVYQSRKRQRGDFDTADRTRMILQKFAKNGIPGQKMDHLCVDEAQDNLLTDALVLRSLCRNPDGLFWAGDTAQAISAGSAFRFNDLKSFLYRIEKQRLKTQSDIVMRTQNVPKTFQLATNYRSHTGIVNCAHSVIELITRFWPDSIDTLVPEKGIVEGLKPVFLNDWDSDSVRYEQFLFGESGSPIEFGAQQCILVRDEAGRQKLRDQVGDIGMIMTLYESKGLEFNDVLLYNFFKDSSVDISQWRVILCAVEGDTGLNITAPQFNESRHAVICTELKFLYVAVTRARKNLWIADQSNKGEPMRIFWSSRDQIHNCTPGMDMPKLAVSSSPEEWAATGKKLFERKRYLQAKHCYERALMPREMMISDAYLLREQARKLNSRRLVDECHATFLVAAHKFLSCAAGTRKNRIIYFRRAGECFEAAQDGERAVQAYLNAGDYDIAAKLLRKLGRFDEAIDVIDANGEQMSRDVVETIKDVARLHYFRGKELTKARRLFSTDQDELEYLEALDLDVAHAEVLESLGRPTEAAELHLSEGRTMIAIPLFLEEKESDYSMRKACDAILQELWRNVSFGNFIDLQPVSLLLEWSTRLDLTVLGTQVSGEISMFKAILSRDTRELANLGRNFLETGNTTAAALCLNNYFLKFPNIETMTIQELADTLELFRAYIKILFDFAFRTDPTASLPAARLFGFHRLSTDEFLIPTGTFLHEFLERRGQQQHGNSLHGSKLARVFQEAMHDCLWRCVSEENELCRKAPQMSPCMTFAVLGFCNWAGCPHEHVPSIAMSPEWYNVRVRVHLQQILIIQTLHSINHMRNAVERRRWINRFYEALNPPFYYLGSHLHLNPALIPEFQQGIQVIRGWVRELAYNLNFKSPQHFLTDLIRGAFLGFTFDRHEASMYWQRAQCFSKFPLPPTFLRSPGNHFMLPELIKSLEGKVEWSIYACIEDVSHILETKIPINVGVLCDLIEFICASTVFANTVGRNRGFHGITLPRSWARRYMPVDVANRAVDVNSFHKLFCLLRELLESIFTGGVEAGYLLLESGNLSMATRVRPIFIARICRALCLLGYNVRVRDVIGFRYSILKTITSLDRTERKFHALFRQYIYAQHWDHLVHALRGVRQGTLPDELVQLHDLRREPKPIRSLHGVTLVPYADDKDLLQLLSAQCISEPTVAPVHQGDLDEMEIPGSTEDDNAAEMEKQEATEHHDTDVVSISIPDTLQVLTHSEGELQAACTIQKLYRRMVSRRRQLAISGRPGTCQRFFLKCLDHTNNRGWQRNSYYRLLFLGPLPHFLVCVEVAEAAISKQKKEVKKLLPLESHEQLEELGLRLTKLGKNYKTLCRLQKSLEPASNIHNDRNVVVLETSVREGVELLQNLFPPGFFSPDIDIASKGILAVRRVAPPKPTKPSLVLDEDFI